MGGDDAVAVPGGGVRPRTAVAEPGVVVGLLLVGEVAVGVQPEGVDAVLAVAGERVARGREAPVAVARLDQAVLTLGPDVQRVVDAPAARRPARLRDEHVGHELLEHAAAPAGDDVHAAVGVGALVDVEPQVGAVLPDRLHLVPRPVAARREGAPHGEVLLGRDLPGEDAEVAGDAGLGHRRVVVVVGVPDVRAHADVVAGVGRGPGRRRRVVEAAVDQPARTHPGVGRVGVVEHVPAHPVEEPGRQRCGAPVGGPHDEQRGAEPAVVDAGEERVDAAAVLRPGRDAPRRSPRRTSCRTCRSARGASSAAACAGSGRGASCTRPG